MSSDVLFIEITFENLDYIVIPANYFEDFEAKNKTAEMKTAKLYSKRIVQPRQSE